MKIFTHQARADDVEAAAGAVAVAAGLARGTLRRISGNVDEDDKASSSEEDWSRKGTRTALMAFQALRNMRLDMVPSVAWM